MELRILPSPDVRHIYQDAVENHNNKIKGNSYPDAGFDIYCPEAQQASKDHLFLKIDYQIKCSAYFRNAPIDLQPTGYFMCPRSSISSTPLRMANSIGIIDSGYRGNLIAKFDCRHDYEISKGDRLMQIVAPDMSPIIAYLVDSEDQLGDETERGTGGFGSTGI